MDKAKPSDDFGELTPPTQEPPLFLARDSPPTFQRIGMRAASDQIVPDRSDRIFPRDAKIASPNAA